MKIFLSLAFFLIVHLGYAAKHNADNSIYFDQYEEATIHFLDGTSVRGYGKITSQYLIKFKVTETSKPDIWKELMVKGITLHRENIDIDFLYVKVEGRSRIKLLEVIELGEISIFAEVKSYWMTTRDGFNGKNGLPYMPFNQRETSFEIFAKRQNEDAINFTTVFKFKKVASKFFENCPQIVDRIKNRTYKRGDIIDMVYYYNDYCAALD